jgi:PD-(D/E)XK endonuclease
MWRKANRLAGAHLKHCKERGEWAELYFMMMAAGLGMKVSKPFGDSGRYDVGVESHIRESNIDTNLIPENQARVQRVQVKSTIYKRRGNCYSLNVMGPQRKKYQPGTVDFFAVLLIPIDDWYIIPFEVMGRKNSTLHFTPASKRQKYGPYREAWHLLQANPGLTIQASSEDQPEDNPEIG